MMSENIPNLEEETTSRFSNLRDFQKKNPKRPTLKDIIITVSNIKDKEKILKAAKEK